VNSTALARLAATAVIAATLVTTACASVPAQKPVDTSIAAIVSTDTPVAEPSAPEPTLIIRDLTLAADMARANGDPYMAQCYDVIKKNLPTSPITELPAPIGLFSEAERVRIRVRSVRNSKLLLPQEVEDACPVAALRLTLIKFWLLP
jgi:hypothetical protein